MIRRSPTPLLLGSSHDHVIGLNLISGYNVTSYLYSRERRFWRVFCKARKKPFKAMGASKVGSKSRFLLHSPTNHHHLPRQPGKNFDEKKTCKVAPFTPYFTRNRKYYECNYCCTNFVVQILLYAMQCTLFSRQKLCFKNNFRILYLSLKVKTNVKERCLID